MKTITYEAQGICSLALRPLAGGEFPVFTAGAHIDLHLPNGLERSYSLINPQHERHRYVVAVNRDQASRGGSKYVHEVLRAGDRIRIASPRNHFTLTQDAQHTVLIAGGIGITPLWCMIQRLQALSNEIDAPFSCMEGVCGTCESRVLEGTRDHRDSVLTPAERSANQTMMICCSGSKSARLVLDL